MTSRSVASAGLVPLAHHAVALQSDLMADGVTVLPLHPGFVRTEMTGHQGLIDAQESAAGLLARIDALAFE